MTRRAALVILGVAGVLAAIIALLAQDRILGVAAAGLIVMFLGALLMPR